MSTNCSSPALFPPVFSRAALDTLLDTLLLTKSTWGIDWAWSSKLTGECAIHVIDAIAVDHTKPVNVKDGALYSRLRAMDIDPRAELEEVRQRFADFGGIRTLAEGHTLRADIPGWAGPKLVRGMDRCILFAHSRGWSEAVVSRRLSWNLRPRSDRR